MRTFIDRIRRRLRRDRKHIRRLRLEGLEDRRLLTLSVNHQPYVQLGNAVLGNSTDQFEIIWQTTSTQVAGEKFKVEFRASEINSGAWSTPVDVTTPKHNTTAVGDGTRQVWSHVISSLPYSTLDNPIDVEYRVSHVDTNGNTITGPYGATYRTRLAEDDPTPFTFVAYGDSAAGTNPGFAQVQGAINAVQDGNGEIVPAFSLNLGDNAYESGSHTDFDSRFSPQAAKDWNKQRIDFMAYGNHDVFNGGGAGGGGGLGKAQEQNYSVPNNASISTVTMSGQPNAGLNGTVQPRAGHNYSFDYGNVHVVSFDSTFCALGGNCYLGTSATTVLDRELDWVLSDIQTAKSNGADWVVVYVHNPVASFGGHTEHDLSDYYAKEVVKHLTQAGADLMLAGHTHDYQRSFPLTYNSGTNTVSWVSSAPLTEYVQGSGLTHIIAGTGGRDIGYNVQNSAVTQQHVAVGRDDDTSVAERARNGFLQIDVTPGALRLRYTNAEFVPGNSNGPKYLDDFRIVKPSGAPVAKLELPLDNGTSDGNERVNQVRVPTAQSSFVIQLEDLGAEGVNPDTVTPATLTVEYEGRPWVESVDYNFAYNAATREITLTRTGSFQAGHYTLNLNSESAKIEDLSGNKLAKTNLQIDILASTLLKAGDPATALVPANGSLGLTWTGVSFDDSTWSSGTSGVGYDNGTAYDALIGLDVDAQMDGIRQTVYIRQDFTVNDAAEWDALTLRMKFDDGFVAYLNGQKVAESNAPASPAWDSGALAVHNATTSVFENFDITAHLQHLVSGNNVLAIHGLNRLLTSSDLLMLPELVASDAIRWSINSGVLKITGTRSDDNLAVTVSGGTVRVSGRDTGASPATIASIDIAALEGNDTIDLNAVTSGNGFSNLTGTVVARGNAGDDTIIGSGFNDHLWGDAGVDAITAAFPNDVIHDIVTTLNELQAITLNGDYVLGGPIDASPTATWNGGAGWDAIGSASSRFTGKFDGKNFTISGLTINRPGDDELGLFAFLDTTAEVKNVRLYDVDIDAFTSAGGFSDNVGGLAGKNKGTIINSIVKGDVDGNDDVGGLVGENEGGLIRESFADVVIPYHSNNDQIGGLVGDNDGGTIRKSYANGSVSANVIAGGLAGGNRNGGLIEDSYSTTTVGGDYYIGGLVGQNFATITRSYSTGAVSGVAGYFGGLVGSSFGLGTYSSSYWDTQKSGTTNGVGDVDPDPSGVSGKTTAQMGTQATFTGWDFTMNGQGPSGVWFMADTPRLQIEHNHMEIGCKIIENVIDLLMMQIDLDEIYHLANDIDASETANWVKPFAPIGSATTPFTGTLNGGGHTITGLRISSSNQDVGLFGYTSGANLVDVVLEDIDFDVSYYNQYNNVKVGGLVGTAVDTVITESEVSGEIDVNSYGGIYAGGLVGYASSTADHGITASKSDVDLYTMSDSYGGYGGYGGYGASVGGLAGRIDNVDVANSSSDGPLVAYGGYGGGGSSLYAGGLIGYASVSASTGTKTLNVTESRSATSVYTHVNGTSGYGGTYAGGLVGYLNTSESGTGNVTTEISESFASGSVSSHASGAYGYGGGSAYAGGLVGYSYANKADLTIANSYARGSVTASTYGTTYAGGLIGYTYSYNTTTYVTNTYSTGAINTYYASSSYKGGLIGYSSGASYTSSYWDTQTSGLSDGVGNLNPDPAGVTGKTTTQMKTQSTFVGWDFDTIWVMQTGDYPTFIWDV